MTKDVIPGEIYEGEVKRIQPFGAFVEILPGKDGLVHVSDMADTFVSDPQDVVKMGDKVRVRVKEIDELGRINLSMILDPSKDIERKERRVVGGGTRPYDNNRGRGGHSGGGFRRRFDRSSGRAQGGPHFPTSRFVDSKKKDFAR